MHDLKKLLKNNGNSAMSIAGNNLKGGAWLIPPGKGCKDIP